MKSNHWRAEEEKIQKLEKEVTKLSVELNNVKGAIQRFETRIRELENQPRTHMQQISAALISAVAGGIVSAIIALVIR